MYKLFSTIILINFLLVLCFSANAFAQSSASEAAAIAKAQTGGKVLQVKQNKTGRYRVKVLMPNGQMRLIVVGKARSAKKK